MTNGEALEKLTLYRQLHGTKLDAPWRKNPNISLGAFIDKLIEGLTGKEAAVRCSVPVERRVNQITTKAPQLARVGAVKLSDEEWETISDGEVIHREVVPGVVARISRRGAQ